MRSSTAVNLNSTQQSCLYTAHVYDTDKESSRIPHDAAPVQQHDLVSSTPECEEQISPEQAIANAHYHTSLLSAPRHSYCWVDMRH